MGYHVMGLGPSDLKYGIDALKDTLSEARFPIVCSNLIDKETREHVFKASHVVTLGGTRFGFYSVCLNSLHPAYKARVLGEKYELTDPLETTTQIVQKLRKECDVLIALSHLNIADNELVADSVDGIDLMVDPYARSGNKSIWITEGQYVVERNGLPILRIDGQGSRVGVCHIYFDEQAKGDAEKTRIFGEYEAYDHPLEPHTWEHPEILDLVAGKNPPGWKERDPQKIHLLTDLFLGTETCGSCHEAQAEFWQGTTHARAMASLDKSEEQHLDGSCVECHSIAFGLTFAKPAEVGEWKDVGCESCHGIDHRHAANPAGHRLGKVKQERCWGCHNPDILDKKFDFVKVLPKVSCPKMEK